jgi:hypothetical protein
VPRAAVQEETSVSQHMTKKHKKTDKTPIWRI